MVDLIETLTCNNMSIAKILSDNLIDDWNITFFYDVSDQFFLPLYNTLKIIKYFLNSEMVCKRRYK